MDIDGSGITTVTFKTLPAFRSMTKLAIKWKQLASEKWYGIDRGAASDIYEASCAIYGKETTINTFLSEIEDNRRADNHIVTLSNFFDNEKIFGANIDHSGSITATITHISRRRQGTWKGWGVNVTFRATSVSFTGASSLPTLSYCDVGVDADKSIKTNKIDTYDGTFIYLDHPDPAVFTGIFTVTDADMIKLRNYIRTQRTGDFTLADNFGVSYPFGPEKTGYPYTCKLIDWEDLGHVGVGWWRIKLSFSFESGT